MGDWCFLEQVHSHAGHKKHLTGLDAISSFFSCPKLLPWLCTSHPPCQDLSLFLLLRQKLHVPFRAPLPKFLSFFQASFVLVMMCSQQLPSQLPQRAIPAARDRYGPCETYPVPLTLGPTSRAQQAGKAALTALRAAEVTLRSFSRFSILPVAGRIGLSGGKLPAESLEIAPLQAPRSWPQGDRV